MQMDLALYVHLAVRLIPNKKNQQNCGNILNSLKKRANTFNDKLHDTASEFLL